MTAQPQRPILRALPFANAPRDPEDQAQYTVKSAPKIERKKIGAMEWLEKRSQPYIVYATAAAAVIRGFYLFTDKLINLAKIPALNIPLSILTGIIMSITSELTISIAGRRHKLYKAKLYAAELGAASANKAQKPIWDVEVKRLNDQVKANLLAMRVSMGMSLLAAASYLIDSTGAAGIIPMLIASSLAGYVLYMMYYHGVQTDEIKEDGSAETAEEILETLNVIRVEEVARLRAELQNAASLSVPARIALIASGLPIPDQRRIMPTVKLLLRADDGSDPEGADDAASWYTMRDIAMMKGEDFTQRRADDIMRKYRRKVSDNAHKHPADIRLDPMRGWLVEPVFAEAFFDLPPMPGTASSSQAGSRVVDGTITEVPSE